MISHITDRNQRKWLPLRLCLSAAPSPRPVDSPSLQEVVYRRLREAIESGELDEVGGDQRFALRDIARQMEVSTTPVREALRRLEAEGLVTSKRGSGVYVNQLTASDVSEIAEIRVRLETLAVERQSRMTTARGLIG